MAIKPILNISYINSVIPQKSNLRNRNAVTNPICNQNNVQKAPSAELLKAYSGITEPKKQDNKASAFDYLSTLPNVNKIFKKELSNVATVLEKKDAEANRVGTIVDMVAEGKLWRGVLRYFCENGKTTESTAKDIKLIQKSKAEGRNLTDNYVPTVSNKSTGINLIEVGDTFEVKGENNIYFKNKDGEAQQLKLSKQTFTELFPPLERFASVQGAAGDCYLLATLSAIMENPEQRGVIYNLFEEKDNCVNVKFPKSDFTYSVPKNNLRKDIDKWQHIQGATGLVLAEHAYGTELQQKLENDFYSYMNSELENLKLDKYKNAELIQGYEKRIADFKEKSENSDYKPVLMRFENPDANGKLTFQTDEFGITFKDLETANKELRRKLTTQADFYRGSIGGDLDTVMKDFGYTDVKEYKTNNSTQEEQLYKLLTSENAKEYIFTAGANSDGTLKENPIAKEYSVYGSHAYKIEPFVNKDGATEFFVENPWNSTQNSVMNYDKLKEYFEVICVAKAQ